MNSPVDAQAASRILNPFFARLNAAPQRLLMLDYDGTLAPFRVRGDEAFPYPGLRERLAALMAAGHTRLVIVTGRPVEGVLPLLGLNPLPEIWGAHGWQRRPPEGPTETMLVPDEWLESLRIGFDAFEEHPAASRIELKPGSLAFHWRGLPGAEREAYTRAVEEAWDSLARKSGLELRNFDGGLELRAPGRDKGSVVLRMLDESPPGAAAAFLGDDLTDEDAFAALSGRGLNVLVRETYRPTRADVWLRPPGELADFLERWLHSAGGDA